MRTILLNIANYFLTNLPGTFKSGYHHVEQIRKRDGDTEQVFPGYYEDSFQEPRPLLNDHDTNYFYLRRVGEVATEDAPTFTSCDSNLIDTYPMRMVFHLREGRTHQGMEWTRDLKHYLSQWSYTIPANAGISRVDALITSSEPDKYNVLANETTGGTWNPLDEDTIISIDFDLVIQYSPGTCLSDPVICGDLGVISQVDPCAQVCVTDTDDVETCYPAGSVVVCTKTQTNPVDVVIWDNFTDTSEVNGYAAWSGAQEYNGHSISKDFGVAAGLNAGASSSVAVTAVKGTLSMDSVERVVIGLRPGVPAVAVPSLNLIEHALYFQTNNQGRIDIREGAGNVSGGVFPVTTSSSEETDVEWEVRFSAGKIQYYWKGILQHTSATAYTPSQVFHVYIVIYQAGAKFPAIKWVT